MFFECDESDFGETLRTTGCLVIVGDFKSNIAFINLYPFVSSLDFLGVHAWRKGDYGLENLVMSYFSGYCSLEGDSLFYNKDGSFRNYMAINNKLCLFMNGLLIIKLQSTI